MDTILAIVILIWKIQTESQVIVKEKILRKAISINLIIKSSTENI